MSISGVSGASAMALLQRSAASSTQSKNNTAQTASTGSSTPSPGSSTPPTTLGFNASAGIEVTLPNGLSVGVFSISPGANPFAQGAGTSGGSGGALSQMISSLEQMVAAFENSSVPGSSTSGQSSTASGSSAAADAANAAGPGASIQGMTASVPNGISVEVFEAEQGNGTSGSDGSSDAMASTLEQLVANLEKYPAAAGAYAKAGANSSAAAPGTPQRLPCGPRSNSPARTGQCPCDWRDRRARAPGG
jgi:hypothetical protein